mmetsp:Transcript_9935/g.27505  ORF Transcript_9935/g.27505 Transcript_9935/m.27505 type:complete len:240 (-) Transcript_9935:1266-1985(-)
MSYLFLCEIQIRRRARPAPSIVVDLSVLLLDVQTLCTGFFVNGIAVVPLNMRINDRHHSTAFAPEFFLHLSGVGEQFLIPGEVSFTICVFNIQPQDIIRIIQLLKLLVDVVNIFFIFVIPSALVVRKTEHGRKWCSACKFGILPVNCSRIGPRHEKYIHNSGFTHPVCRRRFLRLSHIHKRFGWIEPKDTSSFGFCRLTYNQGNRTIKSHNFVQLIFKDVQIVQAVGFLVVCSFARCCL